MTADEHFSLGGKGVQVDCEPLVTINSTPPCSRAVEVQSDDESRRVTLAFREINAYGDATRFLKIRMSRSAAERLGKQLTSVGKMTFEGESNATR